MTTIGLTNRSDRPSLGTMKRMIARTTALAVLATAGGCVNVSAPDKPIEINLNIKITQEVIYRLDKEAKELIKTNPDIF